MRLLAPIAEQVREHRRWKRLAALMCCLAALSPAIARAQIPGLDPSLFPDPSDLVAQSTANEFVKVVGLSADHRPLEPATALGGSGISFGIELSVVQVPDSFPRELARYDVDSSTPPALPVPRLQVQKGLNEHLSIGLSGAKYQDYRIYGGDLKWTVNQPEEGLTWAIRFCYSDSSLGIVKTKTYSPQLLVSRSLQFADPYLGLAYQYTTGKISFTHTTTVSPGVEVDVPYSGKGMARSALAFLGLQLRMPGIGFQLAIEGAWSQQGANSLGTKLGFRF